MKVQIHIDRLVLDAAPGASRDVAAPASVAQASLEIARRVASALPGGDAHAPARTGIDPGTRGARDVDVRRAVAAAIDAALAQGGRR